MKNKKYSYLTLVGCILFLFVLRKLYVFNYLVLLISAIVVLIIIGYQIKYIIKIYKAETIEGQIIAFVFEMTQEHIDCDEGNNVTLDIEIKVPDSASQIIHIRSASLKKPPIGKKIKILLDSVDISKSEIITGTELIVSIVNIVSLLCFLTLMVICALRQ